MCSDSQQTTPQPSAEDMKANGESPRLLTPEQVRAGTNVIMSYAERQAFLKNSEIGKLLGFDRWLSLQEVRLQQQSRAMFVSELLVEKWVGNKNEIELIKNPSWGQIQKTIRELNGVDNTLVILAANDEQFMQIGGGKSGKYIVYATFDNTKFHVLVDLSKPDEKEKMVVGGQFGNYPAKMCVGLSACLLAARTFTELGKLEPSLSWEEDK